MRIPNPCPISLPLLILACAAGCGGGGGGGGPAPSRLEGTLTVPSLTSGPGRLVEDGALDNVAHDAREAGKLDPHAVIALHGHVGGDDARDVFRVHVAGGLVVRVAPSAGVSVEVFEAVSGTCAGCATPDRPASLAVVSALAVDVVVASSSERTHEYRVEISAHDHGAVSVRLPLSRLDSQVVSALQVGYLGADHEMVPGEVIVVQDENHVGVASDDLLAIGLVGTQSVPGPIQRLLVMAPLPAAKTGVPLAQSLELQTCLAAHRACQVAGVRAASPNYIYRASQAQPPNDPLYARQWHYAQINAPQAWALFPGVPGSAAVTVAIVDTGMVLAHPDFAGRLTAGYDMISDAARGLDGDGIDPNPDDPGDNVGSGLPSSFHGTHVGGTVGATSNNSVGVAGMDWACKLMPIRVLGRGGSGTLQDIAQGIRFASGLSNASGTVPTQRCDVMNMSLGGPGSASVLQDACNAANAAGVLLVAAAGNDGTSTDNFPAAYPVCVSVGSIRFDFARASYSNFASSVDVVAPGGDTSVDQNMDGDPDGVLSCLAADGSPIRLGFGYLQGTSMACPHVAGLAALIKAAKPSATATEVRGFIESTTFNRATSSKIIDTFAAVRAAFGSNVAFPVLSVQPGNLGLEGTITTATVSLSNVGNQTIRLDLITPTGGDIVYTSGANWITAVALEGTATATISHPILRVTVARTGLADGRYDAVVTLRSSTASVASAQIPVTLTVGVPQAPNDEVFVLVVNETTFENKGQTQTNATSAFAFSMPNVVAGRYYLVAGTDRDNDDFIGDEGELFGIWPSNDSPLVLEITGNNAVVSSLNFTLQQQSVQMSAGRGIRSLPPIRIRR